jgi:DNA-directed RNA polymerase specialized sigma24 family protein
VLSPETRKRLVGNLRHKGLPERRVEDVVQETLTDVWNKRYTWPETIAELDHLLNSVLLFDRIDDQRKEARSPLLRKKDRSDKVADEQGGEDDEDPAAMISTVLEPTLEARDGLRAASEYVDARPRLHKSFAWLLQTKRGMTYADIAARENTNEKVVRNALNRLRDELRMVFGPVIVLAAFVLVYLLVRALHGYVNDQAHPDVLPDVPRPTPNIVAPPAPAPAPAPTTAPQPSAEELRTRAFAECDALDWVGCFQDLDAASQLDPAGDKAPRVKAARARAMHGLAGKPQ